MRTVTWVFDTRTEQNICYCRIKRLNVRKTSLKPLTVLQLAFHSKAVFLLYFLLFFCLLTICILVNFACFFFFFFFFLVFVFCCCFLSSVDHILSGLVWIQTACKGDQQTTKVATSGERVKV